jgi:hypothetical protein
MKILHAELREDFGLLDRPLIAKALLAEAGIHAVACEPVRNCLSIEYDPAMLNNTQLLDIMCRHGLYPQPMTPRADAPPRAHG